jgi:RNA polymerase sigma factor (sigma-70 family)
MSGFRACLREAQGRQQHDGAGKNLGASCAWTWSSEPARPNIDLRPLRGRFAGIHVTSREAIETLTPGLRRYARALTGLGNGADEIVQATLMRTLEEERRWRDDELKMRVYGTLTQLNRQRQRAQAVRRQGEAPPGRAGAPAKAGSRREAISKALDVLAAEEREALLLVVLEGFNYQEAAEIIGAPKATLVARLMRARAALAAAQGVDPRSRPTLSAQQRSAGHLRVVK